MRNKDHSFQEREATLLDSVSSVRFITERQENRCAFTFSAADIKYNYSSYKSHLSEIQCSNAHIL